MRSYVSSSVQNTALGTEQVLSVLYVLSLLFFKLYVLLARGDHISSLLYPQCLPSTVDNSEEVLSVIIYLRGSLDGRSLGENGCICVYD